MRTIITRFFVLTIINISFAGVLADPNPCPPSSQATTPVKLKDALMCNYDGTIRPVVHHLNKTSIMFRFILKYFTYDHHSSVLSIDAWMSVIWKDHHLTWDPKDYDGIQSIHLSTDEIWVPDLSVYNSKDQSSDAHLIKSSTCAVSSVGQVLCVPAIHIDALCTPDLRKYPFDTQNCTLRFGSWVHKGEELDLKLVTPLVDKEDLQPNGEWALISTSAIKHAGNYSCCPNNTYPSIELSIVMKRLSRGHAASVIIPSVVAVLLTFTSLAMSPLNKGRLTLCYVNVMTGFFHLQYVSWMVPFNGDAVPAIILFARDSLLLAAFSVVVTIALASIMARSVVAPIWMATTVANILQFPPSQMVLLSDSSLKGVAMAQKAEDGTNIVNSETNTVNDNENSSDWRVFGKFLDILILHSYIITYAVLIFSY